VEDAKKTVETATSAYNTKVAAVTTEFKKQDEYMAARKAYDDAVIAFTAARAAALKKYKADDADYKAALTKEASAKQKLSDMRATGGSRDAIAEQSKIILETGDKIDKLEKTSVGADPACQEAQKKVDETKAALDALDAKLADQLKTDGEVTGLKSAMDQAKTALIDANKKLSKATGG